MKECWINVYERDMGADQRTRERAITAAYHRSTSKVMGKLKYRLHVKLKDKPGLVHNYHYRFLLSGAYEIINKREKMFTGSHKYSDWANG